MESRADQKGEAEVGPLSVESLLVCIWCSPCLHGFLCSVEIMHEISFGEQGVELSRNVQRRVGGGHVGNKWGVIYIKEARRVIHHAIFQAWVVEDQRDDKKIS